jgi:hypothetical protein
MASGTVFAPSCLLDAGSWHLEDLTHHGVFTCHRFQLFHWRCLLVSADFRPILGRLCVRVCWWCLLVPPNNHEAPGARHVLHCKLRAVVLLLWGWAGTVTISGW